MTSLRKVIKHRHTKPQIQNTETPDCIKYIYFVSQLNISNDRLTFISHSVLRIIWSASEEGRGESHTLGELQLQSQVWANSHLYCQGGQVTVTWMTKWLDTGKGEHCRKRGFLKEDLKAALESVSSKRKKRVCLCRHAVGTGWKAGQKLNSENLMTPFKAKKRSQESRFGPEGC